jgi:hypothetical protein
MSESYIQLPADSTGKKVRTIQKTIATNVVQSQFAIRDSKRAIAGAYSVVTPEITTTAVTNYRIASIWNPAASGKNIVIKRVIVGNRCSAASAVNIIKLTFLTADVTGTDISANIAKKDSAFPASIALVKHTATQTGTLGSDVAAYAKISTASGSGELICDYYYANASVEGQEVILNADQGFVVQKLYAGDVDDRFTVTFEWEEY